MAGKNNKNFPLITDSVFETALKNTYAYQIQKQNTRMRKNMSPDAIFESEDEGADFQVGLTQWDQKQMDIEKYMDEIIKPQQIIEAVTKKTENASQKPSESKNMETDCHENSIPFEREESDEYSPSREEEGKSKGKKKGRASNQNICKKYHTEANKCLRQLGLYKMISSYIGKVYKRNYFIFVLMICQKANRLQEFIELYGRRVIALTSKCQEVMQSSFRGSPQSKHNQQLLHALLGSLEALAKFQAGQVQQALKCLFNVKKMKRAAWLGIAYQEVVEFGSKIQIN